MSGRDMKLHAEDRWSAAEFMVGLRYDMSFRLEVSFTTVLLEQKLRDAVLAPGVSLCTELFLNFRQVLSRLLARLDGLDPVQNLRSLIWW